MRSMHLEEALKVMKTQGFKYTKKREAMLQFLIEEDKYTSAKEVYDFMSDDYAGISYDTIYRNLHDFSKIDLLEVTELNGEKKFRFHCSHQHIGHHHHFICTECGATREIRMCPMDYFKEQLSGCEIESHRFEIFGKCEKCLSKK
ncbi:Fur family transcriptional regulator [Vagococcus intermedius]|nr:Fur family transcriptional regulator [Vagococcus intermedius]